jgi:hypothetical protein
MPTAHLQPSSPCSILRKHQGDPVLLQGWPPTAPMLPAHRQLKPSLAMVAKTPPIQAQPCLCPRTPTARLNASKVSFGVFQIVPSLMRAKLSQSTLMLFDCLLINGLSMPQSYFFQVYGFYTSILFHGSLLHVLFNVLALVPLDTELEGIVESVRLLFLMFLLAITNAIHLVIAF